MTNHNFNFSDDYQQNNYNINQNESKIHCINKYSGETARNKKHVQKEFCRNFVQTMPETTPSSIPFYRLLSFGNVPVFCRWRWLSLKC